MPKMLLYFLSMMLLVTQVFVFIFKHVYVQLSVKQYHLARTRVVVAVVI